MQSYNLEHTAQELDLAISNRLASTSGGVVRDGFQVIEWKHKNNTEMLKVKCLGDYVYLPNSSAVTEVDLSACKYAHDQVCYFKSGYTKVSPDNVLPRMEHVGYAAFRGCTSLKEVILPVVKTLGSYAFFQNTSMINIQFGSIGHPVQSMGSGILQNTTQSFLATIYSLGETVDTFLNSCRTGAAGAKIVIKASEDTVYNGVSYSAGETMLTSEVV